MTLQELKETIAAFEKSDWYFNYQIEMNFPHINYKLTLKGVPALYEYILEQIEGFEKESSLPTELTAIKKRFVHAKTTIISLIASNNAHSWNNNLAFLTNNNPLVFPIDAPETEFLLKVFRENPNYYAGALEYMSGSLNNLNNKDRWIGYMLSYEFMSKDFSTLAERKESEKKSIATTRSNFQAKLGEAETELTKYMADANKKFVEYSQKIDETKKEKDEEYSGWFKKIAEDFTKFKSESQKSITDLETLYKENLKLKAPAKYWSDRAKVLRKEGYWWIGGLIACIGLSSWILIWVLNKTADGTLQKIFAETSSAIKWSVALVTLISFLAFALRTFSKLAFSSFHLVRDAEEREQLTYVYLALKNEKAVDNTERHLIMQSLFSRADSGLLKEDSGPTMPGNIIDQALKK